MSLLAYKLAWIEHGGYCTSRYGYHSLDAALNAAPAFNRARARRGLPAATHVATFDQQHCIAVHRFDELKVSAA